MKLYFTVSWLTAVEGDPKPFRLLPFGRGGRYSNPWFLHHLPSILPLSTERLAERQRVPAFTVFITMIFQGKNFFEHYKLVISNVWLVLAYLSITWYHAQCRVVKSQQMKL